MEDIGGEGYEGWEEGIGWREGDLEAEDGRGVRSFQGKLADALVWAERWDWDRKAWLAFAYE